MLKRIALAGLACVAVGAHAEDPSKAIDAIGYNGAARLPEVALAPNDLTLDPAFTSFGGPGMSVFWPGGEGTSIEYGLRVFPSFTCSDGPIPFCTLTGYYVAGRRKLASGDWLGIVVRRTISGDLDDTFGGGGWISHANFAEVNDFAMLNDRVYFAGTRMVAGKETFAVACMELNTAADCPGFVSPNESFATHGATGNAIAKRIVANTANGLLVAGYVSTARGREIAVARFDATTGALIGQFNGDGLMTSLPSWVANIGGNDVDIYDMALAPASAAGGARVYIAGTVKRTATDYDGFILALHPGTGSGISGWSPMPAIYVEDDNTGNKKDAITAIAVQRNGQLAMTGWSETDTPNERRLILSRLNIDGTDDHGFCDGAVTCVRNDSGVGVVDDDWPVAIAERAGNRDLVVALTHNGSNANDPHPRQSVWQFGSSGNVKHASQVMDYADSQGGTAQQRWSSSGGMWIGNAGLGGTGSEVIAIAGTRKWDDTDYDMTLSHLIANDSIYADQFGGASSD